MFSIIDPFIILLSYGLGCLSTGYYLIRWRKGEDLRDLGSGNVGARNAGRVLGVSGFLITFLLDCGKGAFVCWVANIYAAGEWTIWLSAVGVVAGHIWPVQLGFKGGKGIATAIGVLLVLDYQIALGGGGLFLILFAITRNIYLSILLIIVSLPFGCFALNRPTMENITMGAISFVMFIAHRVNVSEILKKSR